MSRFVSIAGFRWTLGLVGMLALVVIVILAFGAAPVASSSATENLKPQIGNYCIECHVATPAGALDWARPVEWARDHPSDTLRKAYEEIYQVDTLLAAIQNADAELRAQGIDTSAQMKRLNVRRVTAARLGQEEIVSLAAVSNQGKTIRYQINQVYSALNLLRAERQRLIILASVLAATAVMVIATILGWRNTLKGKGTFTRSRTSLLLMGLAVIVVFGLFANPLFGVAPPAPVATEEEIERQAASDQAARVNDAAMRISAQAWTLAHIGAKWNALDKSRASDTLSDALTIARNKDANLHAYWGQTQAVRESAVVWNASAQDLATYRMDNLETATTAWQYRAMAAEWISIDKAKATELLELGLANLQSSTSDFELRAIAVTYAQLDKAKANALVAQVNDPFLRAWGWREIGEYDRALQAARSIETPYDRAWALRSIAGAMSAPSAALFNEVRDAIAKIANQESRAYALADLAITASAKGQGVEMLDQIDAAFPEARVMALRGVARNLAESDAARAKDLYARALKEAGRADDTYTKMKFRAAIAADLARIDVSAAIETAAGIPDVFLRDQAYRDIVRVIASNDKSRANEIASQITSPAMRAQAFTALGDFKTAFALADKVEDTYVLRELAIAWAKSDPRSALTVVDKLDNSADKTVALQAIALELAKTDKKQSAEVFDRAVNVAKTVRVRGESFAAARALATLASSYTPIDATRANQAFALALDVAKKVNVGY